MCFYFYVMPNISNKNCSIYYCKWYAWIDLCNDTIQNNQNRRISLLWIKKENAVFAITGIQITEKLHGDIGHMNKNKWLGEKINAVVL